MGACGSKATVTVVQTTAPAPASPVDAIEEYITETNKEINLLLDEEIEHQKLARAATNEVTRRLHVTAAIMRARLRRSLESYVAVQERVVFGLRRLEHDIAMAEADRAHAAAKAALARSRAATSRRFVGPTDAEIQAEYDALPGAETRPPSAAAPLPGAASAGTP
jgi:hypothetical protein